MKGKQAYLLTHFEYHSEAPNVDASKQPVQLYGQLPAAINVAKIVQNKQGGKLKAVDLKNVDANAVNGIWTPCAASQTPWGTHLGGEEYEPNAREFEKTPLQPMNLYLGTLGKTAPEGGRTPTTTATKWKFRCSRMARPIWSNIMRWEDWPMSLAM